MNKAGLWALVKVIAPILFLSSACIKSGTTVSYLEVRTGDGLVMTLNETGQVTTGEHFTPSIMQNLQAGSAWEEAKEEAA